MCCPQGAESPLHPSPWPSRVQLPVWQPTCAVTKGLPTVPSRLGGAGVQTPSPQCERPIGKQRLIHSDEDIKADSDPMRQRPYCPQDPQVSWLSPFPWGSLWHWLGSKLIDMHTWRENPVSCVGGRGAGNHGPFQFGRGRFRVCMAAVRCCFPQLVLNTC